MKSSILLAVLATAVIATSCGDAAEKPIEKGLVTSNDFENIIGWGIDPALLSREKAHSGVYSIYVNPAREFSLTYDMALGQISPRKVKKVHVSAWVYLQSPKSSGVLGMQVMDPTKGPVAGDGITLGDAVKQYKKWVEVSKDMVLPDDINSTQHIKFFLWRGSASEPIYLDDIRVSIPE